MVVPKGTYATLSDLQTAFPTGNTNIYIVTADDNWYYWSGSAWTAGGVYQSSTAINNLQTEVTQHKLDYETKLTSSPINLESVYWERGSLSGGVEFPDTTRIRTSDYLQFNEDVIVSVKDGYKFTVQVYENDVYKSQILISEESKTRL